MAKEIRSVMERCSETLVADALGAAALMFLLVTILSLPRFLG